MNISNQHELRAAIDSVCDRFEQEWSNDNPPDVMDFVHDWVGAERRELVRELLLVEFDCRRRNGESPTLVDYDSWHDEDRLVAADCLDELISSEITMRVGEYKTAVDLSVRCPHCHATVSVPEDCDFATIDCSSCDSQFSFVDTQSNSKQPRQLAHFELQELIGSGAFGNVWRATDSQLDRDVAVKIPHSRHLDSVDPEQFFREARAAAQLSHANIVKVHEVGRDGQTLYMVSEFVAGQPLSEWIQTKRMSPNEAAGMLRKICIALHHAHEKGVVHRDLKPANILLDSEGEPHITDFGLAKRQFGEATITTDGQILGTPAYMAPEQARGESHTVNRRADIYALGVMLFEMLTGERPFRGDIGMILRQVIDDDPPSPRRLNPASPQDLETICLRCLEKEPARRYESAQQVAEELNRFLQGRPIEARPIGSLMRGWRWCRRNPLVAGLLAAVVVVLLIGTAVSCYFAIESNQRANALALSETEAIHQRDRALDLASKERTQRQLAVRRFARLETLAYADGIRQAHNEWKTGNARRAMAFLRSCPPGLRGWEHGYVDSLFRQAVYVSRFKQGKSPIVFSPNGELYAVTGAGRHRGVTIWNQKARKVVRTAPMGTPQLGGRGLLAINNAGDRMITRYGPLFYIRDTDGRHEQRIHTGSRSGLMVAFSPDDKWLGITTKTSTAIWNVRTMKRVSVLKGAGGRRLAWSADGQKIAVAGDHTIALWKWKEDEQLPIRTLKWVRGDNPIFDGHLYELSFSPDGNWLVSGHSDMSVRVWNTHSGRQSRLFEVSSRVFSVAVSPDSKRVLGGDEDGNVTVWDLSTGKKVTTLKGHMDTVYSVRFAGDGATIVSASYDGTLRTWAVKRTTVSREFLKNVHFCAVSANQQLVATRGHEFDRKKSSLTVWAAESRQQLQSWSFPESDSVSCATFSSNNRLIAAGGVGNPVRIWNTTTGEFVQSLKGPSGLTERIAWSRDGKWIAAVGIAAFKKEREETGPKGELHLWNAQSGELVHVIKPNQPLNCLLFTPDCRQFVVGSSDSSITVRDVITGKQQMKLRHGKEIRDIVISQDGSRLASAGEKTIRIWDIATGEVKVAMTAYSGRVSCLAFSPDGRRVISGGVEDDNEQFSYLNRAPVKIWDVATGEMLLSLEGLTQSISMVSFGKKGKKILGVGKEGTMVWNSSRTMQDTKRE